VGRPTAAITATETAQTSLGLRKSVRDSTIAERTRTVDRECVGVPPAPPARRSRSSPARSATPTLLADASLLVCSALLTLATVKADAAAAAWSAGYVVLCLIGLRARGLYGFGLRSPVVTEMGRITFATGLVAMLVICARSLLVVGSHVGTLGAVLWLYSAALISAGRAAVTWQTRRKWRGALEGRPTLVIGTGHVGRLIARRLRERPELGLSPVGHLDDDPMPGGDDDLPVLGGLSDVERVIGECEVSHVIISFSLASDARMRRLMQRSQKLGAHVLVVPRLYEEIKRGMTIEHVGAIPLAHTAGQDPARSGFTLVHAADRMRSGGARLRQRRADGRKLTVAGSSAASGIPDSPVKPTPDGVPGSA
jgi:FlaA1/EpsC-like NDP-sugar epimerase